MDIQCEIITSTVLQFYSLNVFFIFSASKQRLVVSIPRSQLYLVPLSFRKFVIITLTAIVPNFLKSCMIHFLAEQVIGSENIDEADMGTEVSRFLEAYREGSVIQKRISGPTLVGFINSQFGVKLALIFILVVVVMALILFMTKEEPLTVGTRDQSDDASGSASRPETREQHHDTLKED